MFPGLSVLSGSILGSLHYSKLGLLAQERFALIAPEKRDKQSTGGKGRKGEGKGESGEGGRKGRRNKSQLVREGLRTHKLTGKLLMAGVFLSWSACVKASQWQRRSNTWVKRQQW